MFAAPCWIEGFYQVRILMRRFEKFKTRSGNCVAGPSRSRAALSCIPSRLPKIAALAAAIGSRQSRVDQEGIGVVLFARRSGRRISQSQRHRDDYVRSRRFALCAHGSRSRLAPRGSRRGEDLRRDGDRVADLGNAGLTTKGRITRSSDSVARQGAKAPRKRRTNLASRCAY